jgi:Tol biopolymer transport system component
VASNLVPGDVNGERDIFVRDTRSLTTIRVSVDSAGVEANGYSETPALSLDGRWVAFYSYADNLIAADANGYADAFVHDLATGATTCLSVSPNGLPAHGYSLYPSLSANGRFAVFFSTAGNLVAGDDNGKFDVFVRDLAAGTTTRVSVSSSGAQGNNDSQYGYLSADGTRVVFESLATNLVPGDTNGFKDIFVRDLTTGTTKRVSVDSFGGQSDRASDYSAISADGNVVTFDTGSTNLVAGDLNGVADVFLHDLTTGETSIVSLGSSGTQGNFISYRSSPSHDGRYVVFKSQATTLVAGDTNGAQDIFLRDRRLGTTTRINVGPGGVQASGWSSQGVISADGRRMAYYSTAANLVAGDTNGAADVFIR